MRTERGISIFVCVVMIIGLVASLTGVSYLAAKPAVGGTSSGDRDMPKGSGSETNLGYQETLSGPRSPTYGDHIVISEIATRGANAYDEFVELYNPTTATVDISGWTLDYYSTSGTWSVGYMTTFPAGSTIASCGFYLWGNSAGYAGVPPADNLTNCIGLSDAQSVGLARAIRLADGSGTVIDKVGYEALGGTAYIEAEGGWTAPSRGDTYSGSKSIERKANSASTDATMKSGGVDALKGNNYDTNLNSNDWIRHPDSRNPQSTASAHETPDNFWPVVVTFDTSGYNVLRGAQSKQFTVTVTNLDTNGHTFNLVVTATQSWTNSIVPAAIYVAGSGGENTATLTVNVPADALVGDVDRITVTATAADNALLTANNNCMVSVIALPVDLALIPHDDAEVAQENPTSPQNSAETRIGARSFTNLNHRCVLKFDLTGIPPNAVIHDAILRLYQYNVGTYTLGVSDHEVRKVVNDSWDEETITWNTAVLGDYVNSGAASRSIINTNGTYINRFMDITAYVNASLAAGDRVISLGLKCQVESYAADYYRTAYYNSKEYIEPMAYATNAPTEWPELRLSFDITMENPTENITVKIEPDNYRQYPGAGRSFDVTVKNWSFGNQYTVNLSVENTLTWPITFDTTPLILEPLESRTLTLTVDVPAGASIGDIDTITVTGTKSDDSTIFSSDSCKMVASRWVSESSSPGVHDYAPGVHDYAVSVVGAGDYIYIATGDTFLNTNLFMRYNTISECWEQLDTLFWYDGTRKDFKNGTAMAWNGGNYIYALYGASYTTDNRNFARYNISTDKWEILADTPGGQGAGDGIAVGSDGLVYAITGKVGSGGTTAATFASYNPANNTWNNTLTEPWTYTDDGAALVAVGDNIYATQGEVNETGPAVTSFSVYNISSGIWSPLAALLEGEDDGTSLAYEGSGDYIYALGGSYSYFEEPGDNFYRYKISINTWEKLESVPTPMNNQNGARLGYSNGNMFYWVGVYIRGGYFDEAGKKLYRYPLNNYAVAVNVYPSSYPGVYSLSNAGVSEAQPKAEGGVLDYVVDVRNMGMLVDTYNLTRSDSACLDWGMVLDPTLFTGVSSGLKVSATLSVTIPAAPYAPVGMVDTITVTATGTGTADSGITQARKISVDQLPSADSYTSEAFGSFNYGSSNDLFVGILTGRSWRSYFQFDLSGITSGVTPIASAKLWVQCAAIDNNPTIEAYSTSDTWTETGITWANQPAENVLLDTLYVPRNTKNTWLVFDVTSLIRTECAGDDIASIVLKVKWLPYNSSIGLKSKESTNAPKLVIEVGYTSHAPINIRGNENFTAANGVTRGSGTAVNPFIIEGWNIGASGNAIAVSETDAYFIVQNCYVWNGSSGAGVSLTDVQHATIRNMVTSAFTGIQVMDNSSGAGVPYSAFNTISNNLIENGTYGIRFIANSGINGDTGSSIVNNTILKTRSQGILIDGAKNLTVKNNYLENVTVHFSAGVSVGIDKTENCLVENNTIIGQHSDNYYINYWEQGRAIVFGNSINLVIRYNTIRYCQQQGIWASYYGGGNPYLGPAFPFQNCMVYMNNIENTNHSPYSGTRQGYDCSPSYDNVRWDDGTYGNYWDKYVDVDGDLNGIWDNPYTLGGTPAKKDFKALVNPYQNYL